MAKIVAEDHEAPTFARDSFLIFESLKLHTTTHQTHHRPPQEALRFYLGIIDITTASTPENAGRRTSVAELIMKNDTKSANLLIMNPSSSNGSNEDLNSLDFLCEVVKLFKEELNQQPANGSSRLATNASDVPSPSAPWNPFDAFGPMLKILEENLGKELEDAEEIEDELKELDGLIKTLNLENWETLETKDTQITEEVKKDWQVIKSKAEALQKKAPQINEWTNALLMQVQAMEITLTKYGKK